ncbi:hypothetical protein NLI96_g1808 [Meripilus lineatus]|uniref:CCHC-type domain-containing protein n=1 Tax=Meripilus lineatus TaxID=2056292 RepID=A0AAD5V9P2_9APHY|nr:hypothetical protein NLI96_g1808 [Physisporinus lineatus]
MSSPFLPSMPFRNHRTAPVFNSSNPHSLRQYFRDLCWLFEACGVSNEVKRKEYVGYYVTIDLEDVWTCLPEFCDPQANFETFKTAIFDLYPEVALDRLHSHSELQKLVFETSQAQISTLEALSNFHRRFLATSSFLLGKGRISPPEQVQMFLDAIPSVYRSKILTRLYLKYPNHCPDDAYPFPHVCEAAKFVFTYPTWQSSPIPSPQPPALSPMSPSPESSIANHLDVSELVKSITRSIAKSLAPAPVPAPPKSFPSRPTITARVPRPQKCFYCGEGSHTVASCPRVEADVELGLCLRTSSGKVVLPSGNEIPRGLGRETIRERLLEQRRSLSSSLEAGKSSESALDVADPQRSHSSFPEPQESLSSSHQPPPTPALSHTPSAALPPLQTCPSSPSFHQRPQISFPRSQHAPEVLHSSQDGSARFQSPSDRPKPRSFQWFMQYQYPALLSSQNRRLSSQPYPESSQSSSTASQVVPKPSQLPRTISNSFRGPTERSVSPSSTQHSFLAKIAPEELEIVGDRPRDFKAASRMRTQPHDSVLSQISVPSPLSQPSLSPQAIPKLSSEFEPRNSAGRIASVTTSSSAPYISDFSLQPRGTTILSAKHFTSPQAVSQSIPELSPGRIPVPRAQRRSLATRDVTDDPSAGFQASHCDFRLHSPPTPPASP